MFINLQAYDCRQTNKQMDRRRYRVFHYYIRLVEDFFLRIPLLPKMATMFGKLVLLGLIWKKRLHFLCLDKTHSKRKRIYRNKIFLYPVSLKTEEIKLFISVVGTLRGSWEGGGGITVSAKKNPWKEFVSFQRQTYSSVDCPPSEHFSKKLKAAECSDRRIIFKSYRFPVHFSLETLFKNSKLLLYLFIY